MKKIFYIYILTLLLVGCSNNSSKDNNDKTKTELDIQIEKTISDLYTDSTKLVYNNNDIYKLVFYYKDDKITGLQHYYELESEKEADEKYAEDIEKYKNNITIKHISKNGKYVIYTFVGEQYEGKTVEDIKKTYTFLVPVYKK